MCLYYVCAKNNMFEVPRTTYFNITFFSIPEQNFIADHTRSSFLDWSKRFEIIIGIAQGFCIFIKIQD